MALPAWAQESWRKAVGPPLPSRRILLCSDTHWGGWEADGDSVEDIAALMDSAIHLHPDHLFLLGDITDHGLESQFLDAYEGLADLVATTKIDRVWQIAGGNHDGLFAISGNRWRLGFHRILGNTSQWYTLRIGNNVFIMLGYFAQPGTWSSGAYGGTARADIMNQNKVDWLARQLRKWDGRGYNIFLMHHFPLHHTNIYTDTWANTSRDRFVYECDLILDLLEQTQDVVAWFSAHVHVDSDARHDDGPGTSDGTILDGATRPDLPAHVHFICIGDIWREHGKGWDLGLSTVANFRYLDLFEGADSLLLRAWNATDGQPAPMSVCSPGTDVWRYDLPLAYPIAGITEPIEYEQAWDVWEYSDEINYPWYQDNEGLRRACDGWIESRWDFWRQRDFSKATMVIDASDPSALEHRIYYSNNAMYTWSNEHYTPETLRQMPSARWIRVVTHITTSAAVYIRDIRFRFRGLEDIDRDCWIATPTEDRLPIEPQ